MYGNLPTAGKGTNFCIRVFMPGLRPLALFIRKPRLICKTLKLNYKVYAL